ncbi:MAG: DUF3618 domain-containing protein [Anaerolineaceae bacterium]|nr:DUF3618 domain-containing protein [Anaerolineaceae bacterium]
MANRANELTSRTMSGYPAGSSSNDPDQIRSEIEQTRARLGRTIDEIQERLSPERLKQQTKETIREATIGKVEEMTNRAEYEVKSWRSKIVRTVKENPVPAALIGVGLGWLIMADSDDHNGYDDYRYRQYAGGTTYYPASTRYTDTGETHRGTRELVHEGRERVSETVENVKERASEVAQNVQEAAHNVQERVSEAADSVWHTAEETRHHAQETAVDLRLRAQQGVRQTKRTFWATMNENPLAVGATAMAVGALVGLALPSTPTEDRLMGERRDELVHEVKDRAQETVKETTEKVKAVAAEAKDAAVETAKEEADKRGLRPSGERDQPGGQTETHTQTPSQYHASDQSPYKGD